MIADSEEVIQQLHLGEHIESKVRAESGAVLTGGGGVPGPETNFNSEVYYPARREDSSPPDPELDARAEAARASGNYESFLQWVVDQVDE